MRIKQRNQCCQSIQFKLHFMHFLSKNVYQSLHKVFFTENLKAGWKKVGLVLLNSDKILSKLPNCEKLILNWFQTPLEQIDLNFLLFNNFSPDGTELREANKLFIFALDEVSGLLDSVWWYTTQLVTIVEFTHTELITAWKEFKSTKEIFNTRKKCTKSKRVALKNKFVFFI